LERIGGLRLKPLRRGRGGDPRPPVEDRFQKKKAPVEQESVFQHYESGGHKRKTRGKSRRRLVCVTVNER